jgi:hypothetical protein
LPFATRYVSRGIYWAQLETLYRHFPREQVHVVVLDDLKSADGCQEQMSRVFAHLGLPDCKIQDTAAKNTRAYKPLDSSTDTNAGGAEVKERLRRFYAPHNRLLMKILGRDLGW